MTSTEQIADPLFVSSDYADLNLQLQSTSPAIDAGVSLGYAEDILQNPVPATSAPDVGAYQHGAGTPPESNPAPETTSVSPSYVVVGSAAQSITVIGTNFLPTTTATVDGIAHEISSQIPTSLQLTLSASDQAVVGNAAIELTNPAPGGGSSSISLPVISAANAMVYHSQLAAGNQARLQQLIVKARSGQKITIAAIGGSITEGTAATTPANRYVNRFQTWWNSQFSGGSTLVNAGIGATDSDYGSLRVQRDVLSKSPDLVIVEFAVNDIGGDTTLDDTYEGLVRQLLDAPAHPALILLFMMTYPQSTDPSNLEQYFTAQPWQSAIGVHYGLPMVSYADAIYPEIMNGTITLAQITPDFTHPTDLGHQYAAQFLEQAIINAVNNFPAGSIAESIPATPTPLHSSDFEFISLVDGNGTKGAALNPVSDSGWAVDSVADGMLGGPDPGLQSSTPGSTLDFNVTGSDILVGYWVFDGPMGQVNVTVDNATTSTVTLDGWFDGTWGGYRGMTRVANGLTSGPHIVHLSLSSSKDSGSTGNLFRLLCVGTGGVPQTPTNQSQTIAFPTSAAQTAGTSLTLSASSTSGLPVSFASTTQSVCTVSGTTATFLAGGTCSIQASQSGNSAYAPATPVSDSFTVNPVAGAPVINSFWVSNVTPTLGDSLTLWWSTTNATSVSIDQGIGTQAGSFVVVTPASAGTYAYTLTAANSSGSNTASNTVVIAAPTASSPKQLTIQNHWLANSGGHYGFPSGSTLADEEAWNGNAQNFLTDMGVYADPSIDGGVPQVYTLSYYDETGLGNLLPAPNADQAGKQLDAVYYNGQRIGKGFSGSPAVQVDSLASSSTIGDSSGLTAHIVNFYGRFFNFNGLLDAPPPFGASAPYISLSDGRTITTVADPTAVDFDLIGRLWIADNGPDQNFKIFDLGVSLTTPVATFGKAGGVFAGPTPGLMGPFRFWGPRGVAHDAAGHIYIASTGLPMQTIGGTDIREFSADGTTLLWQVNGTFVDSGDSDPASQGTQMFVNGKHYTMDYSKVPGQSWSFTGVTLNPFINSDDPRVDNQFESAWVRRISGQKFLFLGNMYGGQLYVLRFLPNSEIAVPTAFLGLINTNLGPCSGSGVSTVNITPNHPCWTANETNKRIRWWWLDNGAGSGVAGDGHFDSGEFGLWNSYSGTANAIDVDDAGGVWYGGSGYVSTYFGSGGLQYWPNSGVDGNGVPIYDFANPKRFDVPFTDGGGSVNRIKYVSATDTMYLAGAGGAYYPVNIYRYSNFVKDSPAIDQNNSVLELQPDFVINLGTTSFSQSQISLDQNTAAMTLPWTFTADEDYIYVAYLDQGKDGRRRGEVTIYSATDGHEVGWIDPGPEVGSYGGAVDLINGINVTTDASGYKIITLEEDGAGKVMAYRWNPASMPQ